MNRDTWRARRADTDEAVLAFIVEHTKNRGYPPTVREVMAFGGWLSSESAHACLVRLRDAGKLTWEPGGPRTLVVVDA